MKFKKLKKRLSHFSKQDELAIHFRTGTSGGKTPENTHPFPLSANDEDIRSLKLVCASAVLHNGIIGAGDKNYSDTALFVKDNLSALEGLYHHEKFEQIISLCLNYQGNRFLTFYCYGNNHSVMSGDWNKKDGIFYSNKDYEEKLPLYSTSWYGKYNPDIFRPVLPGPPGVHAQ